MDKPIFLESFSLRPVLCGRRPSSSSARRSPRGPGMHTSIDETLSKHPSIRRLIPSIVTVIHHTAPILCYQLKSLIDFNPLEKSGFLISKLDPAIRSLFKRLPQMLCCGDIYFMFSNPECLHFCYFFCLKKSAPDHAHRVKVLRSAPSH